MNLEENQGDDYFIPLFCDLLNIKKPNQDFHLVSFFVDYISRYLLVEILRLDSGQGFFIRWLNE